MTNLGDDPGTAIRSGFHRRSVGNVHGCSRPDFPQHGGKAVRFRFSAIAACLAVAVLPIAGGCGGDGSGAATGPAAINGSAGTPDQSATDAQGSGSRQPVADPLHPMVVVETSLGRITVRLDAEHAPLTVENFLAYVDSGHYDRTIFHQVIKDHPHFILGGAYAPDLSEKKARTPIYNEAHNGLKNRRGTIAMARQADAVHSATCYFFFNLADNEMLDHKDRTLEGYGYCVFGEITEGLDVADRIGSVEVHDTEQFERIPVETVVIESIRRVQ
jgi:cyclophilin family peptidyl-prolyl cis-trans isomerase